MTGHFLTPEKRNSNGKFGEINEKCVGVDLNRNYDAGWDITKAQVIIFI